MEQYGSNALNHYNSIELLDARLTHSWKLKILPKKLIHSNWKRVHAFRYDNHQSEWKVNWSFFSPFFVSNLSYRTIQILTHSLLCFGRILILSWHTVCVYRLVGFSAMNNKCPTRIIFINEFLFLRSLFRSSFAITLSWNGDATPACGSGSYSSLWFLLNDRSSECDTSGIEGD